MFYVLNNKKVLKIFKIIIILLAFIFIIKSVVNYILPIKYYDTVDKYSKKYNVEKELVFAVINAESRFNKQALSNKGAIGLMQIMPETGKWLFEKLNKENFYNNILYREEINIELGTYYLSHLLNKFKDEELALCAYNAGANNVYKWLNNSEYSSDGEIFKIPFKETEKYLKKVTLFKKGYKFKSFLFNSFSKKS